MKKLKFKETKIKFQGYKKKYKNIENKNGKAK
jgi:hypothetical protein